MIINEFVIKYNFAVWDANKNVLFLTPAGGHKIHTKSKQILYFHI